MPIYNGGLFSANNPHNDFLLNNKIFDRFIAEAIEDLTSIEDKKTHETVFVDYKDFNVRHLGSIYEGLLEFRLKSVDGKISLEATNKKRKSTGSYFTPDYVVKYIVDKTVGPLMEEREKRFKERLADYEKIVKKVKRSKSAGARHPIYLDKMETVRHQVLDELLGIKVLDPAMGSGHFLVEAVDYITDRLAVILQEHPDSPLFEEIEEIREIILHDAQGQGLIIDKEKLTDTNILKRIVLKRCIYGVDLNEMAVELAKVSLWLHCFTVGAPLSFLDHHLKCGNSLVGAKVEKVSEHLKGRIASDELSHLLRATQMMQKVGELSDSTYQEVEKSQNLFALASEELGDFKSFFDIYLSHDFDNKSVYFILENFTSEIMNLLKGRLKEGAMNEKYQNDVLKALELGREEKFFHWELEFPEVWYSEGKEKENPGFDAVIGNPPYGADLSKSEANYLKEQLSATSRTGDTYELFLVKAGGLIRGDGSLSMIIPASWLTGERYILSRKLLNESLSPVVAYALPFDVFPGAYIDAAIIAYSKSKTIKECLIHYFPKKGKLDCIPVGIGEKVKIASIRADEYHRLSLLLSEKYAPLLAKLSSSKTRFGDLFEIQRGIQPYSRKKHTESQILKRFLHSDAKLSGEYLHELQGKELSRYWIAPVRTSFIHYCDQIASPRPLKMFRGNRIVLRRR